MSVLPGTGRLKKYTLFCLILLCIINGACAYSDTSNSVPEPGVYFNFNEGSGEYALDAAGNGNAGALHGVSRLENGGCGRAVFFNGINDYGEIPFSSQNHPTKEITVSLLFFTDTYGPQVLISSYEDGGYRLGFDDGNDLWWTINLEKRGEVSIPVQYEGISPRQWHQVTGTYDGQTMKVYLDGVLRNQLNATGAIHYEYNNYVMLGADAGVYNKTDQNCPQYFRGGLDEVRIYPVALTYGRVMDDRFSCSQEPVAPSKDFFVQDQPLFSCVGTSGPVILGPNEEAARILSFSNQSENGTVYVTLPPGSTLVVKARDFYSIAYPDAWYVELSDDEKGRITRSIAFPNTNNAPVKGVVPSGNATVRVKYFDGRERFPAKVAIQFESIAPPPPPAPQIILNYPIIVIYSASWVTLIAIILVMVWLHQRKKGGRKEKDNEKDVEKIKE